MPKTLHEAVVEMASFLKEASDHDRGIYHNTFHNLLDAIEICRSIGKSLTDIEIITTKDDVILILKGEQHRDQQRHGS